MFNTTIIIMPLIFALASSALAGDVRCTTYEEKTLQRWQTVCDDGTRAVSRYNKVLDRYETTITESPNNVCTGQMDPIRKQVQLRCR